jgi:hypothetical protein
VAEFYEALLSIVKMVMVLLLLGGGITLCWVAARWVLGPLDVAAKGRHGPFQFTLGDFLGLFFLAQVPTAALMLDRREAWLIVVFGWFAFGLMWLGGVHTLSRAGITNPWHRAAFVAVVIPGSVAGLLAMAFCGVGVGVAWSVGELETGFALMGCFAVLGVVSYALGRLTRRMVARRDELAQDTDGQGNDAAERRPPAGAAPASDPFADHDSPTTP